MKVNIYTIYDVLAEECGPVFQAKNDKVACRAVDNLLKDSSGFAIPDMHVYCLGYFDNETRAFTPEGDFGRLVPYEFNPCPVEVDE